MTNGRGIDIMGKLGDLWQQIRDMDYDDPRREEVQKEINNVEQWMIDKGYKDDGITKWGDAGGTNIDYPYKTGYVKFDDIDKLPEYNT